MTVTTCIVSTSMTLAICAVYHGNQNNGDDIALEVILGLSVFTTILCKIPFVNKKHYSPSGLPVVAAGQRISSKIQNGGA